MRMRRFDSWSLSPLPIPPRSQLYGLEPIGIGTSWVESLTSYVGRLAAAHSVKVGDLAGRILSQSSDPKDCIIPPEARAAMRGGHGFKVSSYTINGVTDRARKWVQALEWATCRHDLQYLTLLPFRYALPDHLFHRHRTWCSLCLEQWHLKGQIIYEPLIWAIKTSSCCVAHLRRLSDTCPCCARAMSPLSVLFRPGYCGHCSSWLGTSDPTTDALQFTEDQGWALIQVGGLLAMLPLLDPIAARASLRRNLTVYLEEITNGNVLAFTEYVRCPGGMLRSCLAGTELPRIENLLRIAWCLNVPVSSFFTSEGLTPMDIASAKQMVAMYRKRVVLPSRHANEIRRTLQLALDAAVPISVIEIARRLGYTTTNSLYTVDRKLCYKISARYQQAGGRSWWMTLDAPRTCDGRMRELLEQSLKSTEPTPVYQIAASLGHPDAAYIRRQLPDLCAAVDRKIAQAKMDRFEKMGRILKSAIHEIPVPSLVEVARRLGYSYAAIVQRHEPGLCKQLLERQRVYIAKRKADLERQAIVALGKTPTLSVRAVCRRLGITVPFMNKHFPAVVRSILEQRRCASAEEARHRDLVRSRCRQSSYYSCGFKA